MTRDQARQVIDIALSDVRVEALREAMHMVEDYGNAMLAEAERIAAADGDENEWRDANERAEAAQELVNKLDALAKA